MKYSNEFKVGLTIVVAVAVFIIGFRYFQDIPIFSGTYTLHTHLAKADGLTSGNAVTINGVNVGRVEAVRLNPQGPGVRITFEVDNGVTIPEGSVATISGIAALNNVQLEIALAAPGNPAVADGDTIPGRSENTLTDLLDQAPGFVGQADTLLIGANAFIGEARTLLESPQSDLNRTLRAIQGSADALDQLLRAEQAHLSSVLRNVDTLTTNLTAFTGENSDSLALAIQNLNRVLDRLDRNLVMLESTSNTLDDVVRKVNQGEGTLGLLVNDPGLYYRLDSTVTTLNTLLLDFQQNPKRYLKDLNLIDVF